MSVKLSELPFSTKALQPYMSQETLEFHYGKHHKHYVETLNKLILGSKFDEMDLEDIILEANKSDETKEILNNAAQAWNHTFFWNCLSSYVQNESDNQGLERIYKKFGSIDNFKKEFTETAVKLFGSGWVWLTEKEDGALAIEAMPDAENPLMWDSKAILVCDVWEHAYYLDYQNDRERFLNQFWNIVNWDFVEKNLNTAVPFKSRGARERAIDRFFQH